MAKSFMKSLINGMVKTAYISKIVDSTKDSSGKPNRAETFNRARQYGLGNEVSKINHILEEESKK